MSKTKHTNKQILEILLLEQLNSALTNLPEDIKLPSNENVITVGLSVHRDKFNLAILKDICSEDQLNEFLKREV